MSLTPITRKYLARKGFTFRQGRWFIAPVREGQGRSSAARDCPPPCLSPSGVVAFRGHEQRD